MSQQLPGEPETFPDDDAVDFDFDASWAEKRAHPPRIRAFGKVYELPPVMPAILMFDLAKMEEAKGKSAEVSAADQLSMLALLLGEENLDGLMKAGLGLEELGDLLANIMNIYGKRIGQRAAAEPDAGGNALRPAVRKEG